MAQLQSPKRIFLAPAPRRVKDIFAEDDLERLRALGELAVHEDGPVTDAVFDRLAADAQIIIGQIDLPAARLDRARNLRAVFNVEGNFLPNIDYAHAFRTGVRVLNISPVFAEPVGEVALAMAIDLGRGISRSDRYFRQGTEQYGLAANHDAYSLYRQEIGFIGMGDLGRAFAAPAIVRCACASLRPLAARRIPAVPRLRGGIARGRTRQVAGDFRGGVTSQNQGFLGAEQFASMRPGASLVLVSRAGVVDFDSMLDFAEKGHIRVAIDVFPEEPVPTNHRVRRCDNVLLSPHQAGALHSVLRQIGKLVVADAQLISRGLPPVMCKLAQPETVALFRSKPVARS